MNKWINSTVQIAVPSSLIVLWQMGISSIAWHTLYLHIVCICIHTFHSFVRILFHYKTGIDPTDSYIDSTEVYVFITAKLTSKTVVCIVKKWVNHDMEYKTQNEWQIGHDDFYP